MTRALVTVLLAAALAACGQQASPEPSAGAAHTGHPDTSPASSSPMPGSFDDTAKAFVELVVATDDQAVELLDLGAGQAGSPALRTLANDLAAVRRAELTTLHGILAAVSVPYVNNHRGHDMPGMPTDGELATLSASGAGFDAEFARLLRAHLTESATVMSSGAKSITHEETKAAAETMALERADALRRLDALTASG